MRERPTNHATTWGAGPRRLLLLAISGLILVVWTIVLPWLGDRALIRSRIEFLEHQGVDPAAMFYTELPAMPRLEKRTEAARKEDPSAFWSFRTAGPRSADEPAADPAS